MPTSIRITPTVWRSIPDTCAVTAYFRIAPTAISSIEVPMVMPDEHTRGSGCPTQRNKRAGRWFYSRGGHGRGPAQEAGPRVLTSVAPLCAVCGGAVVDPESDPTDSGGGSPMKEQTR